MKKMLSAISLLLILASLLLLLVSCGSTKTPPTEASSTPKATTPTKTDPPLPPVDSKDQEGFVYSYGDDIAGGACIVLDKKQNRFSFNPSAISGYIGIGSYEEKEGKIVCKTVDERYTLFFLRHEDGLQFIASESTAFGNIPDGAIFCRAEVATNCVAS